MSRRRSSRSHSRARPPPRCASACSRRCAARSIRQSAGRPAAPACSGGSRAGRGARLGPARQSRPPAHPDHRLVQFLAGEPIAGRSPGRRRARGGRPAGGGCTAAPRGALDRRRRGPALAADIELLFERLDNRLGAVWSGCWPRCSRSAGTGCGMCSARWQRAGARVEREPRTISSGIICRRRCADIEPGVCARIATRRCRASARWAVKSSILAPGSASRGRH